MGRHKENWNGYRKMIIELCLEYGFVPQNYLIKLVAPSEKVMYRKINEMLKEGIILRFKRDGCTVLGLNKKNIDQIAEYYGYELKKRYIEYSENNFDNYRWTSKKLERDCRRRFEANIIPCMLYGLCDCITESREDISTASRLSYYNSVDYKKFFTNTKEVGTLQSTPSRNFGIIKNEKDIYLTYILKARYKFDYISEAKGVMSLNKWLKAKNIGEYKGSFIFTVNDGFVKKITTTANESMSNILRNILKPCYIFPLTKEGKKELELFLKGVDIKRQILAPASITAANDAGLSCDGYDDNGYHLVLSPFNICTLLDFIDLANTREGKFTIYAYEHQIPALEGLKDRMTIRTINFGRVCETYLNK